MEALRVVAAESAASAQPGMELFGSFLLGTDEFALPAMCIREVVNFPERMTHVPLAPYYLEGMFTLRGAVIPVVNLGRLFDRDAPAAEATNKIAIIDYKEVQVGLLVHATGEVLKVRPEQRSVLRYAEGQEPGVVAGTILLEQGRRLLQVLDIERLVSIENVPQVLAVRAAGGEAKRHLRVVGERRHGIVFKAAGARFALEMMAIQEIIQVPEIQPSVLNSKLCLGRIHFRGSQVGVVDFAALLDGAAQPADAGQRIVVARIDGASVGFLVDEVDSIVHFTSDEVLPIPLLSKARSGMFAGCVTREDLGDIIVLDHGGIFSSSEIAAMHQGHARLFPVEEGAGAAAARNTGRKVYLTFAVQQSFALPITEVREIIECTAEVTPAPGMPEYLRGILNLRQKLISIVDLRRLYGMPPSGQPELARVLVIERGEECYGLLVDGVQDIVTVDDGHRYATPSLMRKEDASGMETDAAQVLELEQGDGETRSICLLDLEHLLAKVVAGMTRTTH